MNPRSYDSAPRHLNALNTRLANIAKADGGNDLTLLANIGRRLFAARRVTPWPPTITIFPRWEQIYTQSAEGLDVRSLPDAVVCANILIDQANAGASKRP
jgi:hypothetical protein